MKVAVLGAAGRMGRSVLGCLLESADLKLTGAVTEPNDRLLGHDAGELMGVGPLGVPLTDDPRQGLHGAQVAVDFTLPTATEANLRASVESGSALVIGTTGLEGPQIAAMERAAHEIPIVYARNMSVGVNVFMNLVGRAAKALGEQIAAAKGRPLADLAVYAREGRVGPRVPGTIGFSVIRGGNIVGEHTVRFIGAEEQVELVHVAQERKTFARGALRAARWVAGRAPGLYSMVDVLGLARG